MNEFDEDLIVKKVADAAEALDRPIPPWDYLTHPKCEAEIKLSIDTDKSTNQVDIHCSRCVLRALIVWNTSDKDKVLTTTYRLMANLCPKWRYFVQEEKPLDNNMPLAWLPDIDTNP